MATFSVLTAVLANVCWGQIRAVQSAVLGPISSISAYCRITLGAVLRAILIKNVYQLKSTNRYQNMKPTDRSIDWNHDLRNRSVSKKLVKK